MVWWSKWLESVIGSDTGSCRVLHITLPLKVVCSCFPVPEPCDQRISNPWLLRLARADEMVTQYANWSQLIPEESVTVSHLAADSTPRVTTWSDQGLPDFLMKDLSSTMKFTAFLLSLFAASVSATTLSFRPGPSILPSGIPGFVSLFNLKLKNTYSIYL